MKKKSPAIQIRGMAKGYVAVMDCDKNVDYKIFLFLGAPKRQTDQNFHSTTATIYALNQRQVLGRDPSEEIIKKAVLMSLKSFVQNVGDNYVLRKVPSEEDLIYTTNLLVKQLDKQRRKAKKRAGRSD